MKTKSVLAITILTVLSTIGVSGCQNNNDGKVIVDSAGDEITLPSKIERVVVTTEPAIDMMVALGVGDKISGAYKNTFNNPWLERFWPNARTRVESITSYQPEAESLIASGTDIIFVPTKDRAEALRAKGICAITLRMFSPNEVREGVGILGEIFGEEVKEKGKEWINDFQNSIDDIATMVSDVPETDRKSCYQLMGDKYKGLFRTNYGDTLDYFVYGGGTSALAGITDAMFTDNMPTEEAVLGTNPDVIFVNGTYASKLIVDLKADQRWSAINAVVNNEIYRTPVGFCDWSAEGSELVLMNYWVFSKLYPEKCTIDFHEKANSFYEKYFGTTFTNQELDYMFDILSPEGKELCE